MENGIKVRQNISNNDLKKKEISVFSKTQELCSTMTHLYLNHSAPRTGQYEG